MATVSPIPFAIGMVAAVGLLAAWLDLAIAESRKPLTSRALVRREVFGHLPATELVVHAPTTDAAPVLPGRPEPPPPEVRPERTRPPRVRVAPVRVAVVVGAFVLWSVWTARRPHGRGGDARPHD